VRIVCVCVCVLNKVILKQGVYKVLVWKPWKEYPALKDTYEDNVKEHIMEVEWEFVDWIHVAQDGGGAITGSPLGLSTTLFFRVFNVYVHSLIWTAKCHRHIKPSGILRHVRDGLLQVNLEG
jgi:hypothetical protein